MRTRIMERHNWLCAVCGGAEGPFDIDHEIPIGAGGRDDEANLRPLCRHRCHKEKTKNDAKRIAKTRRQMAMRLDAPPKVKKWARKIQSAGFQNTLRKKLDGTTVQRTTAKIG